MDDTNVPQNVSPPPVPVYPAAQGAGPGDNKSEQQIFSAIDQSALVSDHEPVTRTNDSQANPPENNNVNQPPPPVRSSFFSPIKIIILLFLILLISGLLFVFGSGKQNKSKGSSNNHPQTKQITPTVAQSVTLINGKLSIGIDATYPPMESVSENGLVGFDIDLGKRIAQEMHLVPVFIPTPFDTIFDGLDKKKFDIIISSVSITDEKKQKYDFSPQYLNAGDVIITRSSSGITVPEDLNDKKVGVVKDSAEATIAAKLTAQNLITSYHDISSAVTDVTGGKIDALITNLPNAKNVINKNPSLKIASNPITNDYYGIAYSKGNTLLEQKINTILLQLTKIGYLNELKHAWFE